MWQLVVVGDENRVTTVAVVNSWEAALAAYRLMGAPPAIMERRGNSVRMCPPRAPRGPSPVLRAVAP